MRQRERISLVNAALLYLREPYGEYADLEDD